MNLVIVESPAKAKTINKYLGGNFKVLASYGHVRDLPSKDGSVKPDEDFKMVWDVDSRSKKRIDEIARAAGEADALYLATDPDREGEAISWHVLELLDKKGKLDDLEVKRVVFHSITKDAIADAMANPRALDKEMIDAYLARRALDYLVGFTLSPVLWRKLPGARSAGRVQSVALRLICDRELEIETFEPREYWTIDAELAASGEDMFTARLVELDGGKLGKFDIPAEARAREIEERIAKAAFAVANVERKPVNRNPAPPFITSTLQQEAARKLGFAASHTMRLAQQLYEGVDIGGETVGLITYMRTDSVTLAGEALGQARGVIEKDYGERYLPETPRQYKTKSRSAQEAHEAIRPTSLSRRPKQIAGALNEEQRKLYDLIWKRTIASQMKAAQTERTTAEIVSADRDITLRATGSVLVFDGFLTLYQEGRDDDGNGDDDRRLPPLKEGQKTDLHAVKPEQHFTEPPPRYTEASLVKKLEELGIGRPSTYASILEVLRARNYVHMDRNRFVPEDKGRLVTAFLESFFERYVEYDFTARLEEQLDEISAGKIGWKDVLRDFWSEFSAKVDETTELRVADVLEALNELLAPHIFPPEDEDSDPRKCPECEDGRLSLKIGKYGAFIGCSNYPDCRYTRPFAANEKQKKAEIDQKTLGTDPDTGLEVTQRSGRYGPYVQLGEGADGEKPKRASIPKDVPIEDLDLDLALRLLSLPRTIGEHPEDGKPVIAGIGRYGPYVAHSGQFASLSAAEEVFSVGLNRAVSLLAEAKEKKGKRFGSQVLKELGEHPDGGGAIQVMKGRYGPYVKHKSINATIPKGREPDDITLDEAVQLIAAKAAKKKSGGGRKRAAKS